MKSALKLIICAAFIIVAVSCGEEAPSVYDYDNILDISYTPNKVTRSRGWFSDCGSWYGFTVPQEENWVNGFCGPFALDGSSRRWISDAAVQARFVNDPDTAAYKPVSTHYYPGELQIEASSATGTISQSLVYLDSDNILIRTGAKAGAVQFYGSAAITGTLSSVEGNKLRIKVPDIGKMTVTFPAGTIISANDSTYSAIPPEARQYDVVISFNDSEDTLSYPDFKGDAEGMRLATADRWQGYLGSILRDDMPAEYNRVAVKSVVTLISNWKKAKGDLFHDGVVPSQGVGYFVGFWGWDSWKHAAALSLFAPEVAKDQVRAVFDYQTPEGMVIDCLFTDSTGNNRRDSKPPLAAWAVDEIYRQTGDTAFVREILPALVRYHQWWYRYRDNDHNGICEYGSCDGTLVAAAWESGMDNAVRFDSTKMVKNTVDEAYPQVGAWSMDQESVDLNGFLAYERRLLYELADACQMELKLDVPAAVDIEPDEYGRVVADRFFCTDPGFFFDRRLSDGSFVKAEGTEACIPLWTGIATQAQADAAHRIFTDTAKFAIYIPFPTVSADNPSFDVEGYWRGSTWLDQVYFGIDGLRRYGFHEDADRFTRQVFDRLEGLTGAGPICENYNPLNGKVLEAPNFSWSAAHLLLLYESLGR